MPSVGAMTRSDGLPEQGGRKHGLAEPAAISAKASRGSRCARAGASVPARSLSPPALFDDIERVVSNTTRSGHL